MSFAPFRMPFAFFFSSGHNARPKPAWRNWQTRRLQVAVPSPEYRFDSCRGHESGLQTWANRGKPMQCMGFFTSGSRALPPFARRFLRPHCLFSCPQRRPVGRKTGVCFQFRGRGPFHLLERGLSRRLFRWQKWPLLPAKVAPYEQVSHDGGGANWPEAPKVSSPAEIQHFHCCQFLVLLSWSQRSIQWPVPTP